jgi:hypothetical protein
MNEQNERESAAPNPLAMAIPGLAMTVLLIVSAVEIVRDPAPHAPWVRVARWLVAVVAVLVGLGIPGMLGFFIFQERAVIRLRWPGMRRYLTVTLVVAVLLAIAFLAATR